MKPILYIVIPCYNEEEVLPITKDLFLNKLKELISKEKISDSSRVMFLLMTAVRIQHGRLLRNWH